MFVCLSVFLSVSHSYTGYDNMSLLDIMGSYRPQRSCGNVMFSHLSVILSTGVFCPSACWDTHPPDRYPPGRHPLWANTPWAVTPGQTPSWADPPAQCMLGYTTPCPVHSKIHMAIAADGTHPTGIHSCH